MELTWLAGTSLLLVGVGYAFVQKAPRFRLVCWGLLCVSLFALATRDLFRPHEQGRPASTADADSPARSDDRTDSDDPTRSDDERDRPPLFARLRGRLFGWFG
jgi:hypothetical protein